MKIRGPRHLADLAERLRDHGSDERGSSAVEMAIIFPVTIFIIFGIIQFGLWYHAAAIARAAAQEGARAASVYQANAAAGSTGAEQVLHNNAGGLISHVRVVPYRDTEVATVTVSGQALQVIPFIPLAVHATAAAPVEAYRPPPRS
jgi:Flp pilus assembly protein TadG